MKKFIFLLLLIVSQVSFASILNSKLEDRHQVTIVKAINDKCGNFVKLIELKTSQEVVNVDQGIQDIKYKTVLSGLQWIDQYIFDEYEIVVDSEYADMYDHSSQNWGAYFVSNVSCSSK